MLCADVGDDGAFTANDFGMILGVHSDGQLEAPECLWRRNKTNNSVSGFTAQPDSTGLFIPGLLCVVITGFNRLIHSQ